MEANTIIEYKIGLSPARLTIIPEWYYKRQYSTIGELNRMANLKDNKTKAVISRKSAMKIQRAVQWLSLISSRRSTYCKKTKSSYSHKLSMITLTIPLCNNIPSLKECNRNLLVPFLKSMKKYYGLESYVWVSEYQENGMPHYHITTNSFLHYSIVQKIWNRLLNKHNLCLDFENRHGHRSPPSTQAKSILDDSKTANYLAKYMSKDSQQESSGTSHRWGASSNILALLTSSASFSPQEYYNIEQQIQSMVSFANITGSRATYFMSRKFDPRAAYGGLGAAYRHLVHQYRSPLPDLFRPAKPPQSKPPPPAPRSQSLAMPSHAPRGGQWQLLLS